MILTHPNVFFSKIKHMLGLVSLLLVTACGETAPQAPPLKAVSVAVPLQREVVDWDEFIGRFEAIEDVEIKPRVSGTIEQIAFREGLEVRKGQLLFVIDQRTFRNSVAEAQAEITQNEATVTNARTEMARAKTAGVRGREQGRI